MTVGSIFHGWFRPCQEEVTIPTQSHQPLPAVHSMDLGPQSVQDFTVRFEQSKANQRSEPAKVIPALKNGDWREFARKRQARAKERYIPPGSRAEPSTKARVSETINSGPSLVGLHKRKRTQVDTTQDVPTETEPPPATEDVATEDERARRALIAEAEGVADTEGATVEITPLANSSSRRAPTEDEAFRQDIEELPNEATLQDYERMPVSQFGAALLRGMGWKPGDPVGPKKNRIVEPWLPTARPAMLGIGAKEREIFDDGSGRARSTPSRPERKYTPLIRVESGKSSPRSQPASRSDSRRPSRSPPRKERREGDRDRRRDPVREREGERERERGGRYDRYRESERDRDRDRRRDRERSPRPSRRDRDREHRDR